jgi:hypothetical protein
VALGACVGARVDFYAGTEQVAQLIGDVVDVLVHGWSVRRGLHNEADPPSQYLNAHGMHVRRDETQRCLGSLGDYLVVLDGRSPWVVWHGKLRCAILPVNRPIMPRDARSSLAMVRCGLLVVWPATRTACQESPGHKSTLRDAASQMRCASICARASSIPQAGQWQAKVIGPGGGSRQTQYER